MERQKSLLTIGIKEILSNFTPAYIILFFTLYLLNKFENEKIVVMMIFLAGLAAIAMSAIQPYILKLILRPSKYIRSYAKSAVQKKLQQDEVSKKPTRWYKDYVKLRTQKFFGAYLPHINASVEKFWKKKEKLQESEQQFFDIKEGRLFLYLYLFFFFIILFIINLIENFSGHVILWKIYSLSKEFNGLQNFVSVIFFISAIIFLLGFLYELKVYRDIIHEEIPVFAVLKTKNNIDILENKIQFLEDNKDNFKDVYSDLKKALEKQYKEVQKLNFEKNWINLKVHEETELDNDEIDELSDIIARVLMKSIFRWWYRLFFIGVIFSFLVNVIFFKLDVSWSIGSLFIGLLIWGVFYLIMQRYVEKSSIEEE